MRLRFLGTGTSMGVPIIGCRCPVCTSNDPRNHRTRTSALLYINEQQILIDAGPDFRQQALTAGLQHIDAVLLTHAHFDHVAGLDDLRPLSQHGTDIPIYGSTQTLHDVRERFAYAFDNRSAGSTRPALRLCPIDGPFAIATNIIEPFEVIHGTWSITGYRIGKLGYVTDASTLPLASKQILRGVDVLVLNALRYEAHPTHYSLSEALTVAAEINPRACYLVHMTHAFDHPVDEHLLPPGVNFAYDGLEIEISV
jgi:phosphoribosyl 1,2-cyclic phosphate phosphodiesterase